MTVTIAIVGRPNVGKSTLFNRLAGRRLALVADTPGLTRDRREATGRIADMTFTMIDTAGFEDVADASLSGRMQRQTEQAIADADLTLFLIDARAGITPLDEAFADALRRSGKPVVVVANKCEGRQSQSGLLEAFALGMGEPVPFSAEHGDGLADLYEALAAAAPELLAEEPPEGDEVEDDGGDDGGEAGTAPVRPLQLAIVGRPNVGKSTLVNALLREERLLTGPEAGITRDAIAVEWVYRGRQIRLVDTAGLRRKARVVDKLERLASGDTLQAIRFAEVVVLVLDAQDMLERQDLAIARQTIEEGRALVIAANKWDIIADKPAALARLRDRLETSLPQVRGIPVVALSARTGQNLERLMDAVLSIHQTWNRRVSTSRLNEWLADMTEMHPPPMVGARRVRLRYMTQVKARPPTFVLWTTRPDAVAEAYLRYLANGLRDAFDLAGVPLRLLLRKGRNPYAPKDGK